MKYYYRFVDIEKGKIKSLFHGTNGSRTLPLRKWIKADIKEVSDGSRKTSTVYKSGFHILPNFEDTKKFLLKKFKNLQNKAIVKCRVRNKWPKAHSPNNIYLCEFMFIEDIVWKYNNEEKIL